MADKLKILITDDSKLLRKKLRDELEKLALGAEIVQGQSERFVELKVGDNIRDQFNVEVVVEDDKIIAIRS